MDGSVTVIGFPSLIWLINSGTTEPLEQSTLPYLVQQIEVFSGDTVLALATITFSIIAFEVPIAFYSPQWQTGEFRTSEIVSQTDIMPSVLAYLGYKKPFFAFGEDALTQTKTHNWAICYNHPVYQLFSDSLLVQFDGEAVRAVYNHQKDILLQENISSQANTTLEENFLRAYIQQYIYRLTTNQLTITSNGSKSR